MCKKVSILRCSKCRKTKSNLAAIEAFLEWGGSEGDMTKAKEVSVRFGGGQFSIGIMKET